MCPTAEYLRGDGRTRSQPPFPALEETGHRLAFPSRSDRESFP